MDKERLVTRIKENLEDMEDALVESRAFGYIQIFRDYTDEVLKIIEEEIR